MSEQQNTCYGDAADLIFEMLQFIGQVQGDREQVYTFFQAHIEQLDETLLSAIPTVFSGLIQKNDPTMIAAVFSIFGTLINQFPLGSRKLNLEMGIAALEQALQIYPCKTFPEKWAEAQNNLAAAYSNRIQGERADNLEQAIEIYEQVLKVHTRDAYPTAWAMTQNNLATAYFDRIRGKRADNLEQAIETFEQVLKVYTRDAYPEQWAMTRNNLANAYSSRIMGERAENIEQAIASSKPVLEVYTRDAYPEQWAMTQNSLANAYSDRIRGERAENIEQAIISYEQALKVYTRDTSPEKWSGTQNNLGTTYSDRLRGERADNLEKSIAAYEQALTVYTRDTFPEDWAMAQNNLGIAYSDRLRGERADNLERSIAAYEQALTVYTRDTFPEGWARTQNNLANAYTSRIRGERAGNLKQAIATYEQALQVRAIDTFPKGCRETAQNLGNLHFQGQNWGAAEAAYQTALNAGETLYQASISYSGKGDELKETGDTPHHLAYVQAKQGKHQAAILTLERSRARRLSESLNRDRADLAKLQTLAPHLYNDYQNITQQLRNLENRDLDRMFSTERDRVPRDLTETTKQLRQDLDQTITQIRQVSGYEDFLTPTKWEDVALALRSDNPLVYLVTTPNGSMAMIASADAIEVLWLNTLTTAELRGLLQNWFTAYNNSQSDRQAWYDAIDTTTRQLWDVLMGPLVQKLQEMSCERITLIPTGYLSLLPLHAAWTEDDSKPTGHRYALDDLQISYTPNAKSLTAARAIRDRVQADSILAIENPSQDLPNSEREIQAATSHFPEPTMLRHEQATVEQVRSQLSNATVAHFSCHGTANLNEPLTSGLIMHDDLLTLKDIFALNLADTEKGNNGLRLAILSACETGMIGLDNADEAISLPTGLLQAGVAGVVSSLWSVDDRSTTLLLKKFYEFWCVDGKDPAQALRQAQIWLRDSTEAEIAPLLGIRSRNLSNRPFSNPYYWAAFGYTGV